MKVCIIAEGCYPYVTGGVSSWIQMLMQWMPEHEFVICAIGAEEKDRGKFKYTLPENVVGVEEVFLDTCFKEKGAWGKRFRLPKQVKDSIKQLLLGRDFVWDELFKFLLSGNYNALTDLIMSKDFFDILTEVYIEKYPQTSFTDFFWTTRAMLLPLFHVVRQGMPPADLYHSVSTGYAGIMGSLGNFMYKKPFVLTEHGIYTREREEEIIKSDWAKGEFKDIWIEYFYAVSKCAYNSADKVITLYNRNKEIQVELGCDEKKTLVIPNGIKIEDFEAVSQKDSSDTFMNIGAVVRVVPIKDIKTMIQAFALVKDEIVDARFFIMGPYEEDKEYYDECLKLVESLQVKDIVFSGPVNVKDYIGKMDMIVLTSISEAQPLAVLEAMACGRPVVATDVGSCKELLYGNDDLYGTAGIVVPVMDYEAISQAIIKLCKDEKLRKNMGINGFARVSDFYTKEKFIQGYKDIYIEYGVR